MQGESDAQSDYFERDSLGNARKPSEYPIVPEVYHCRTKGYWAGVNAFRDRMGLERVKRPNPPLLGDILSNARKQAGYVAGMVRTQRDHFVHVAKNLGMTPEELRAIFPGFRDGEILALLRAKSKVTARRAAY